MTLYHILNKADLKKVYDNTMAVPDFAKTLQDMRSRTKRTYKNNPHCQRNLKYGKRSRNTIDYFPTNNPALDHAEKAPLYIFIHGGY